MITELRIRRFDAADEVRSFPKGRFEVVRLGHLVLGRATYEPGWKWSEHLGPEAGKRSCDVAHLGMVVSGRIAIAMDDGEMVELGPGDLFECPPGHDSWVVGNELSVSLHFMGAEEYAGAHGESE